MMRHTTALTNKLTGLGLVARSLLKRHPAALTSTQAGAAPQALSQDIAIGDWQILFDAVTARLRQTVMDDTPPPRGRQLDGNAHSVQASVLECVGALEQLQLSMEHELTRCRSYELQAFEAKAALAQSKRLNAS